MIKTKQITLSLFLSGAMAAGQTKFGPVPVLGLVTGATDTMYEVDDPWVIDTHLKKQNLPTQLISSDVLTKQETGLYACVTSQNVGYATQRMQGASGKLGVVAARSGTGANTRSFYQFTKAQVGVAPTLHTTTPTITATPSMIPMIVTVTGYTNDGVAGVATMDQVLGDFYECCPYSNDSLATKDPGMCLTKVTSVPASTATNIDATSAVTEILKRIVVSANLTTGAVALSTANSTFKYEPDFILGALSQISDEGVAGSAGNWCDKQFLQYDLTTPKTASASNGFSSKTKCSWQLQSTKTTNAPQFKVKAAGSAQYWIQWIEAAPVASTASLILPEATVAVAAGELGVYPVAEGMFFNPFLLVPAESAAVAFGGSSSAKSYVEDVALPNSYYVAGTPGATKLYQPMGTGSTQTHQQIRAAKAGGLETSGVVSVALMGTQTLYTGYTAAVNSFNALATTYNTALTAYETAVTAGTATASLPTVPKRPCQPTALPSYTAIDIVYDVLKATLTARNSDVASATHKDKAVLYYAHQTGDDVSATVTTQSDAARYGHVYPNPSSATSPYVASTTYVEATTYAGHVFGRLGQGKMSMPGEIKPWRWNQTSAIKNTMQVSIFPSNGNQFTVLTAQTPISIEISEATIATSPLTLPSSVGVPTLVVLKLEASATALALSAVAMTVAAAALY